MKLSDVVALSQLGAEPLETEAIVAAAAATTYNTYGYDFDVPVEDRVSEVREGARFRIPLVLPEEAFTGDNRKFKNGVVEIRELPLPLVWQVFSDSGHVGSVIVGRIDHMERIDGGIGNAYGVFDTGPYGREAERLVRNRMLNWVSADLDNFEATVKSEEPEDAEAIKSLADDADIEDLMEELEKTKDKKIKNDEITVTKGRVMGATLVAMPAFQQCKIMLDEDDSYPAIEFGDDEVYEEVLDDPEAMSAALVAAGAPVIPPREWFDNPRLSGPTPITVDDDGRVYGHIAAWNVNHIGLPGNTKPPRSRSNYAYFRTGVIRTDDGSDIPVGQLTLAGGHAPLHASASDAVKHYDDTASAMADVAAGEDAFGIWVAGALRPDATPEQVRALRASAPSGDWRPIGGRLELVAVCQVNVPGFPVARACVASGSLTALVAAGARPLAELRQSREQELEERLRQLELIEFNRKREEVESRMSSLVSEHDETVLASARARLRALED
jgi:hypothetical protein